MEENNTQSTDPRRTGIIGLKGLEGINRLRAKGINIDLSTPEDYGDYRSMINKINREASPTENVGIFGLGASRYDKQITSQSQLDNLNNTRGELQPW